MEMAPAPADKAGFTLSPNQRGTVDILWSCLFTIFLCTWTVVHPNIPPPGSSWWHKFFDRVIGLVLVALAPELTLGVAVKEWLEARESAKVLRTLESKDDDRREARRGAETRGIVTAFYIMMGGLQVRYQDWVMDSSSITKPTLSQGGAQRRTGPMVEGHLTVSNLEEHIHFDAVNLATIISESEIRDKGKADSLIKTLLSFQVLWLATQCVARTVQHLAITPLETTTMAYVPCMLFSLVFWWRKPYNVEAPTLIDPWLVPGQSGTLVTKYLDNNSVPVFKPARYQSFVIARECWKVMQATTHAPDPVRGIVVSFFLFAVGGVHCSAWNFPFPSPVEQWLWRISAVALAAYIPTMWFIISLYWVFYRLWMESVGGRKKEERGLRETYWHGKSLEVGYSQRSAVVWRWTLEVLLALFVIDRFCLIALVFTSLRSLPEDCYRTVDWMTLLPRVF